MTELDLLVFGCAVLFIAAAGAYVFARERYVYSRLVERRRNRPARKPEVGPLERAQNR